MLHRLLCALVITALPFTMATIPAATAADERVLLDMKIRMLAVVSTSQCFELEPGRMTATVSLAQNRLTDIRFNLGIAANVDAERVFTLVPSKPMTYSIPVESGIYCFNLADAAREGEQLRFVPTEDDYDYVALKLTWTP